MATIKKDKSFGQEIRINIALLKFSGSIPPEQKTLPKMFLSYCLTAISFAVLWIQSFVYIYDFLIHAGYIETATESFALTISFSGGLIRNSITYWWREKILDILQALEDVWKILNIQERRYVTLYIKSTKNLTCFFLSQCIATIFFYSVSPLFVTAIEENQNGTRILPYAFFVEVHRSPYYEIIYVFQIFSVLNVGFTCVGTDMIGPLLINAVCGHLKVIQKQLENLDHRMEMRDEGVSRVQKNDHRTINESFENGETHFLETASSELRSCVNYHRKMLTICTDIEELTNIIFLTQLIGSTYILSAVGFKFVGHDQDKYKYISQIIIGMVQLLICNWPPDALLTESQAVADAAYSIPWYQLPNDLKKSVHILILRAQKPVQLTAGKLMYLSLETFASMVSSAVSFFTVLKSCN